MWKGWQSPGVKPRKPGLSCQCSSTEPQQPDDCKPSQYSICTAQVVLNAPVTRVHVEDCESWWSSGCHGSVAEYWQLKPGMSWVWLLATASLFTFLYFCLIASKFIYVPKLFPLWFILLLTCYPSSLDWDKYKWTEIGDEGATALADVLRLTKSFKMLKWVTLQDQ